MNSSKLSFTQEKLQNSMAFDKIFKNSILLVKIFFFERILFIILKFLILFSTIFTTLARKFHLMRELCDYKPFLIHYQRLEQEQLLKNFLILNTKFSILKLQFLLHLPPHIMSESTQNNC